jgi:Domain of unknown function (DUF5666)
MKTRLLAQVSAAVFSLATLLSVTACGGGGSESNNLAGNSGSSSGASAGSSGSPTTTDPQTAASALGSITGFGSVIVNGIKYDDSQARLLFDDKSIDIPSVTSDLKIGMQVQVRGDNQIASLISVASQFRGQITAVSSSSISVMGQSITIETTGAEAVALEGFSTSTDIKVGDWVEIYAIEASAGVWRATRIERESSAASTSTRMSGKIASLDTTAKTFKLGNTVVSYVSADLIPTNAVLANDSRVRVYSDTPVSAAGVVTAKKVRVQTNNMEGVRNANLGGIVSDFVSPASFMLNGIKVDASKAVYKNGSATDLVNGAAIRAKGSVTGGLFSASEVEFKRLPNAEAAGISVKGFVTDYISASNFKLRGQVIDASKAIFEGGNAASLANGAFVEATLSLVGGALVASKVEFIAVPTGTFASSFAFFGLVSDYDAVARTFKIAGNTIKITNDAINAQLASLAFANGKIFSIEVKLNGTVLELTKINSSPSFQIPPVVMRGIVSSVSASGFQVNGLNISFSNSTTYQNGTASVLVAGSHVSVSLTVGSNTTAGFIADKVEFETSGVSINQVKIQSIITDYVSKSDFRVGGAKVDASAATFADGTEADLANGKRVKVEGSVNDTGVLKATKVEFR